MCFESTWKANSRKSRCREIPDESFERRENLTGIASNAEYLYTTHYQRISHLLTALLAMQPFPPILPVPYICNPTTSIYYTLLEYPTLGANPIPLLFTIHFLPSSTQNTLLAIPTNITRSINPNASV
jgi:hypothetical protein